MLNDAEIELEHIAVELRNRRGQHLRHFIDQYCCYKLGMVTRGGRADWERLMEVGVISRSAELVLDRKALVKEHVVPLSYIRARLLEMAMNEEPTHEAISRVVDRYFVIGAITKTEDAKLRNLKLGSCMPRDFEDASNKLYGDVFSRYRLADIEFTPTQNYAFAPVAKPTP